MKSKGSSQNKAETVQAITALTALAQESRLEVFRLLVRVGPDGMTAGEIAKALDVTKSTLSFHLKELSHAGLIKSHRSGRWITYQLQTEGIRELFEFLLEDCCQGKPELCSAENVTKCC